MNMNDQILIFLERPEQVHWMLKEYRFDKPSPRPLVFGAEAACLLQECGIDYLKPGDFCGQQILLQASDQIHFHQVRWVEHLDRWLQEEIPEFKALNFNPAHANFTVLKRFFDQLLIMTFQLNSALEVLRPGKVLYFKPENDDLNERLIFNQTLIGHILPLLIPTFGIQSEAVSLKYEESNVADYSSQMKDLSPKLKHYAVKILPKKLVGELRVFMHQGLRNYIRLLPCRMHGKIKILVVHGGYDMLSVVNELAKLRFHLKLNWVVNGSHDSNIRALLSKQWVNLPEFQELSYFLPQPNQALWNLAKDRLSFWWHQVIPETWEIFLKARKELKANRLQGIVTNPPNGQWRHRGIGIVLAAKSLSIPVIMYQHGGFVGSSRQLQWDMADLWQADYFLCYGEGTRSYFLERARHYHTPRANPVAVGSARLDSIRGLKGQHATEKRNPVSAKNARPLILYIPTVLCMLTQNLCGDSTEPISYLHLQQNIIQSFKKYRNFRLMYKSFLGTQCCGNYRCRGANVIPKLIQKTIPDAIIVENRKLTEVMWDVDGIIVDLPSTALLEVLLTDKPIVAYVDKAAIQMLESAKTLLRKRASLSETAEEFVAEVEKFLAGNELEDICNTNDEFLLAYGTHSNNGQPVSRIASTISKILDPHL